MNLLRKEQSDDCTKRLPRLPARETSRYIVTSTVHHGRGLVVSRL